MWSTVPTCCQPEYELPRYLPVVVLDTGCWYGVAVGTNPIHTARLPDSQTPPDGQTEMTELLTVWLAQRKGLLCVGPQFAHARVPAVAPVPCTCSSFPCRFVCFVQ